MALMGSFSERGGGSFTVTLLVTFGTLLAYLIFGAIRNLYFHPLSKFPGPKLWAASRIPFIVSLLKGDLVKEQVRIHQRYGDVVRMAPNEISFAKEEAWQDIYLHRPGHKDLMKDKTWYIAPNDMPQNIVTTTDPVIHARMRKLLSNSFTEKSLRSQEPLIESYADLLMTRLRSLTASSDNGVNGAVIDLVDWANYFTVDIIGDLAFGESFDCLKNSEYHPWVKNLYLFLQGMIYAAATRFYPSIEWLFYKLLPKSVMEMQRQHTAFANDRIHRRLSLEKDRPDFMTPFMKDNADFRHMSLGEIESTFAIIIVAGSETTATTLCGTVNYLVQNPKVLRKLVQEIRRSFAKDEDITIAAVKELPYLDAVINEGLRLCNPVPGGLPRVVPKGGDMYAGHWIPESTTVSVRPYVITHSEKYFSQPEAFVPERWLPKGERPAKFDSDHLGSSNPFSVGPTGCLGRNLAWAEMRIFLSRFIWTFDVQEEEGRSLDWTTLKTMMILKKEPVKLVIKIREDMAVEKSA